MSRFTHYILNADGDVEPCDDVIAWAEWFERASRTRERIIAHDRDEGPDGIEILVSTVFLGLDHAWGNGPPVLWETLVMGGLLDGEMRRYSSREAALQGHQEVCRQVAASIPR